MEISRRFRRAFGRGRDFFAGLLTGGLMVAGFHDTVRQSIELAVAGGAILIALDIALDMLLLRD